MTLTVAESFQIAKDVLEKDASSSLSSIERPSTSATSFHQVFSLTHHDKVIQ